jgi:hypothetical protein
MRAMLHIPHGIIFAATDGIMSLGPLEGLPTVREKELGKWEFAQELDVRFGAVFVHPGIYSFYDTKKKEHTKTRGFKIDLARDFMMRDIVQAWKQGAMSRLMLKSAKRASLVENLRRLRGLTRCAFDEVALALRTASAAWRRGSCL